MNEFEIQRTLVVSTGHLAESDNEMLETIAESNLWAPLSLDAVEYGFLIWVPVDDSDLFEETLEQLRAMRFSEGFLRVFSIAKDQGCQYLKLDCDGPNIAGLPTYDW